MSPLRWRMIEDMSIRKFTPRTQHNYVRFVNEFSIFRISDVTNCFRCRPPNVPPSAWGRAVPTGDIASLYPISKSSEQHG
jgi:hypothetical protein